MKNPNQLSLILRESDLQKFCDDYLEYRKVSYFRIPDAFWKAIYHLPVGIQFWIRKVFGGWPDATLFFPIDDRYCLAVMVELKLPGGFLRSSQRQAAHALPWVICRSPDEVQQAVTQAEAMAQRIRDFLNSENFRKF